MLHVNTIPTAHSLMVMIRGLVSFALDMFNFIFLKISFVFCVFLLKESLGHFFKVLCHVMLYNGEEI